jgi:HK97 gp10 family phage protein
MGVEYTLNTRGLYRLIDRLGDRLDAFVRALAFDVEATAKRLAPVDTGFLRSSIAVRDKRIGDGEAEVVVSAEYGIYVETGARGRTPRPFLGSAVRIVGAKVEPMLQALATKIEGDAA